MNAVWTFLILGGIAIAALKGDIGAVTGAIMNSAHDSIQFLLGLAGIITFWSGIMRVAERSGMINAVARCIRPLIRFLFPQIPPDGKAAGAIGVSMAANLLGLGNACTPLGLKAMRELADLAPPGEASDAMCTYVVLTTSSITLIPTTVIGLRAQMGSANPGEILLPTLFATVVSTIVALVANRVLRR